MRNDVLCCRSLTEYRMLFISASFTYSTGIYRIDMFFNIDFFWNYVKFFCESFPFYQLCSAATYLFFLWNVVIDWYAFKIVGELFAAAFTACVGLYRQLIFFDGFL